MCECVDKGTKRFYNSKCRVIHVRATPMLPDEIVLLPAPILLRDPEQNIHIQKCVQDSMW